MYAVIRTGSKQYRVSKGDRVKIEKIPGQIGDDIRLEDVLMIGGTKSIQVGTPKVEGATVTARILEQDRSKKILVYKAKKRKKYRRLQGHRQAFTRLEITGIEAKA